MQEQTVQALRELQKEIHESNAEAGWWKDLTAIPEQSDLVKHARRGSRLGKAIVAEKLCLVHSEISESMEGARKNLMDDKLPHRKMLEVELADAVIRILDLCGALELDLAGAMREKMQYNSTREDHKIENRMKDGGKAY
jgi:NTP pyrophosphatase (non-canonical NTP hydrolase)